MIRSALSAIVLGAVVLVPLVACTTEPQAGPTSVVTDPPSTDGPDPCDLLTADELEALTGESMTDRAHVLVDGVLACQMDGATQRVQLAQVPAAVWAGSLPAVVDTLRSADGLDDEQEATLDLVGAD